jgi:hypothetical protein
LRITVRFTVTEAALRGHCLAIGVERYRHRATVLAHPKSLGGQRPPGSGQREAIVVADHSFHFKQLLLPHASKQLVDSHCREFEHLAQGLEVARAFLGKAA